MPVPLSLVLDVSFFFLYLFSLYLLFFFFNDTATTEIYTLSLHDALPISSWPGCAGSSARPSACATAGRSPRSEEHTSELQSHSDLVCRLLLEKKKNKTNIINQLAQDPKNN